MTIYFLSLLPDTPCRGYWDYAMLEDLLPDYQRVEVRTLPEAESGVIIIPARSHSKPEVIVELKKELKKIKKKVIFLMGDEERVFPIQDIENADTTIYIQNADPAKDDGYRHFGCGYTPHVAQYDGDIPVKDLDYFFAGQITHRRREEMQSHIPGWKTGRFLGTEGFTLGLKAIKYVEEMARAKTAPCPSGPETPDTFRIFEALELGAVPIADTETPTEYWEGFWPWLFDEPIPFPVIRYWTDLVGYIDDMRNQYPTINNKVQAWWLRYKNKLRAQINDDIINTGNIERLHDITAIIPVSPIRSYPNIDIVTTTIRSIRHHLKNIPIILTFDGVREEQSAMRADYEEAIRRILWQFRKDNIIPYIFPEHTHQVGMMRAVIDSIKSPTILYMEQDTPLVLDYDIPFEYLSYTIEQGISNMIRFHFEGQIPKEHRHLMIGEPDANELQKTIQWSQRPHLASTAFYKRILAEDFSSNAKCFIEDRIHGKVIESHQLYGLQGWNQWRLHIYHPQGGNIKRCYHLDGRAGEKKYAEKQTW